MDGHYGNHRCHVEKNDPIAFILPSRWQDGAESLGIETTSCLCSDKFKLELNVVVVVADDNSNLFIFYFFRRDGERQKDRLTPALKISK